MTTAYALIFGTIGLLSISVVALFAWAVRAGQFSDFRRGATSIFDEDEPLGEMTDWFPDHCAGGLPDAGRTAVPYLPMSTDQDHADTQ